MVILFLAASVVVPVAEGVLANERRATCRSASTRSPACAASRCWASRSALTFVVCALIYYVVPKGHVPWRGVWPGALFVTVDDGARQRGLPVLPRPDLSIDELGGALGFILVALLWFYLVSLALLAGAVINALRFELHETGSIEEERARAFAESDPGPG